MTVPSTSADGSLRSALATLQGGVAARLAVLDNRDFRRLLAGRVTSVVGDNLYAIAAMWLVYSLTGSTAFTGLAGFLTRAPGVLEFLVGPIVDRSRLDRTLAYAELVQAPVVLVVPVAAVTGHLDVWVVLAAMPLLGLVDLFSMPAQNAAIPRIVDRERLVRANSLGAATKQVAIAAARALGGGIVALVGPVLVYALDAVTFLVGGLLFWTMEIPGCGDDWDGDGNSADGEGREGTGDGEEGEGTADGSMGLRTYWRELRGGAAVLAGSVVGWMLVASLFANLLTGVALAVLPAFADGIGGVATYGLLLAGMMGGRVVGSLTASLVDEYPLGRTTVLGFVASGLCWVGAVLAYDPLATVVLFGAARVPAAVYSISVLATLQSGVPDGMLGRVSSLVTSATAVVVPAGMLLGGLLGDPLGAATVVLAGGVGSLGLAAVWLVVPDLREFGPPTEVSQGAFA